MIAHSCGCRHARELRREHVRIVESANQSIAFKLLLILIRSSGRNSDSPLQPSLNLVGQPVGQSVQVGQ